METTNVVNLKKRINSSKLEKIRTLALRGVDGERENAQRILDRLGSGRLAAGLDESGLRHILVAGIHLSATQHTCDAEHREWCELFRIITFEDANREALFISLPHFIHDYGLRIFTSAMHPNQLFCKGPNVAWCDIEEITRGSAFYLWRDRVGATDKIMPVNFDDLHTRLAPIEVSDNANPNDFGFPLHELTTPELLAMDIPVRQDYWRAPGNEPWDGGGWLRVTIKPAFKSMLKEVLVALAGTAWVTPNGPKAQTPYLPNTYFIPYLYQDIGEEVIKLFNQCYQAQYSGLGRTMQEVTGLSVWNAKYSNPLGDSSIPQVTIRHLRQLSPSHSA